MSLRLKLARWLAKGAGYTVQPEIVAPEPLPAQSPPPFWVHTLKGWALVGLMFDENGEVTADPKEAVIANVTLAMTGEVVPLNMPSCWMTMQ